jgi:hypothetical protein
VGVSSGVDGQFSIIGGVAEVSIFKNIYKISLCSEIKFAIIMLSNTCELILS